MSLFRELALAKGFSGGGNPNSVQTITGTLADPFGTMSNEEFYSFCNAYYTGAASALLVIDGSGLGADDITLSLDPRYNEPTFCSSYISSDTVNCGYVSYFGNRSFSPFLESAKGYTTDGGIVEYEQYATLLPTTLTIIWHPLPT